jgi:hypothetical protein
MYARISQNMLRENSPFFPLYKALLSIVRTFTSVFRTVLVLAEADPVVLVDVTVRDAVNLLALSLFCFSVSADGLVGLLRGTRGLAGAVVGRGLGGVDVFGEATVFDALN